MLKYILACIISVGAAYCGANTEYITGIENEGSERRDIFRIGSEAGGVDGYTAPSAGITKLTIDFVQSGTVPSGGISSHFSAISFPETLKYLYLRGDATSLDVLFNGVARNALPTPPNSCKIHFSLTTGPDADPGWFQSRILEDSNVYVEPLSDNPRADSLLVNLGNTNTFYLGSNVQLASTTGELSCKIVRHPDIKAEKAYTDARLITEGNIIFRSRVDGISLGCFDVSGESRFDVTSLIVDPDESVEKIALNGTHSEDGMLLYITYLSVDQHDLTYKVYGSNSHNGLTKPVVGTTLPRSF